jgi:hypothetical protein
VFVTKISWAGSNGSQIVKKVESLPVGTGLAPLISARWRVAARSPRFYSQPLWKPDVWGEILPVTSCEVQTKHGLCLLGWFVRQLLRLDILGNVLYTINIEQNDFTLNFAISMCWCLFGALITQYKPWRCSLHRRRRSTARGWTVRDLEQRLGFPA